MFLFCTVAYVPRQGADHHPSGCSHRCCASCPPSLPVARPVAAVAGTVAGAALAAGQALDTRLGLPRLSAALDGTLAPPRLAGLAAAGASLASLAVLPTAYAIRSDAH